MEEIDKRRSVRSYLEEAVSDEAVEQLLKAAMRAPSAGNEQPWEFVVVRSRETMRAIMEFHPYARMLESADCAVVVCGNLELQKFQADYWVQDCSAATENLLLEAVHLGLGAVWIGIYPEEVRVNGMRALLNLPAHVQPLCAVALGYPAGDKEPADTFQPRRIHRDRW